MGLCVIWSCWRSGGFEPGGRSRNMGEPPMPPSRMLAMPTLPTVRSAGEIASALSLPPSLALRRASRSVALRHRAICRVLPGAAVSSTPEASVERLLSLCIALAGRGGGEPELAPAMIMAGRGRGWRAVRRHRRQAGIACQAMIGHSRASSPCRFEPKTWSR
jgi:hypothetical protein